MNSITRYLLQKSQKVHAVESRCLCTRNHNIMSSTNPRLELKIGNRIQHHKLLLGDNASTSFCPIKMNTSFSTLNLAQHSKNTTTYHTPSRIPKLSCKLVCPPKSSKEKWCTSPPCHVYPNLQATPI